jgi:hypothetical protein
VQFPILVFIKGFASLIDCRDRESVTFEHYVFWDIKRIVWFKEPVGSCCLHLQCQARNQRKAVSKVLPTYSCLFWRKPVRISTETLNILLWVLWCSLVPPQKCWLFRNWGTAASYHIVHNSLFTDHPIIWSHKFWASRYLCPILMQTGVLQYILLTHIFCIISCIM